MQDVEEGYTTSLAVVSPERTESPFPLYEFALMTAARAYDMGVAPSISVVTPESAPLAMLGAAVSQELGKLLARAQIHTITHAHTEIPSDGRLVIEPGDRRLDVQIAAALPELYGATLRGIPLAANAFVAVDAHSRLPNIGPVYAAGDLTLLAVKLPAGAARQADAAAESIAALAGAPITPKPFNGVIRGALLTVGRPLGFLADVRGRQRPNSLLTDRSCHAVPGKLLAKYLAPALDRLDREGSISEAARDQLAPSTADRYAPVSR
jgi:sulfide:quinone oxidoreductase